MRRRHRYLLAALAAAAAAGVAVAAALGDAPDPKVAPQTPSLTVKVTHDDAARTTTVTVTGGWVWTTHSTDCNTDRAGVGFAVDWHDPDDPGYHVTTLNGASIDVGSTLAVNGNSVDNVVHPTPGAVQFGGGGKEVDVAVPGQYASWRGGCGTFTFVESGGSRASEGRWGVRSHVLDPGGADTGAQDGLSHVYKDSALADGISVCAIMYDVHKGQSASQNGGVGVPGSAKEITAGGPGHNGDNGAEGNKNTPLGNACVPFHVPPPPTAPKAADLGTSPSLVPNARVSVSGNRPTGRLTFELFGPDDSGCTGTPAFRQTVQVSDGAAETANDSFVASAVGTWRWRVDYAGDANNLPETSPCGLKTFSVAAG